MVLILMYKTLDRHNYIEVYWCQYDHKTCVLKAATMVEIEDRVYIHYNLWLGPKGLNNYFLKI